MSPWFFLDGGLQVVNLQMDGTRKTCHLENLMIMPTYLQTKLGKESWKGKGEFYLILNLFLAFLIWEERSHQSSQLTVKATETVRTILTFFLGLTTPLAGKPRNLLISSSGATKWMHNNEVVCYAHVSRRRTSPKPRMFHKCWRPHGLGGWGSNSFASPKEKVTLGNYFP